MFTVKRLPRAAIDNFKRLWPCHGLPDGLESITCEFAPNGDLVDITLRHESGAALDSAEHDSPALLALTFTCQSVGKDIAPGAYR